MAEATFQIFDHALLRRRRDRAAPRFAGFDFLVTRAGTEIVERLSATNRAFERGLDLGCHTGRLAALDRGEVLPALTAHDLSAAMAAQAPGPAVVGDPERLAFADAAFDLVISVLSLHWVNDLPGALIQIRRALKPDGLLTAAMFGGETLTELRQSLMEAEIETTGGASPRISPFAELRDLGSLLQRAGLALPVTDSDRITVRYDHPLKLMADLRGMGETNALIERRRGALRRDTLMRACEIYADRFGLADGRVPATFEILYFAGWCPHESQQKPLRPGSARMRLADALGTEEHSAGDKARPAGAPPDIPDHE